MSRKAGVISIDMNVGSAKMVLDLERGKAALREFGSSARGSVVGATAVLRDFESGIGNNNRAVARFLATVPGVGKALQYAFAPIAILSLGAIIGETGKKVYEFFKNAEDGGKRMADAFRGVNAPLRSTNDELAVSNARLDVEIAKLEGKRQNTLALALAETKMLSDKLGESLEKNLKEIDELLKKDGVGPWEKVFAGSASTGDLKDMNDRVRHSISAVQDDDSLSALEKKTRTVNLLNAALKELNDRQGQASISIPSAARNAIGLGPLQLEDSSARDAAIRAMRQNYSGELTHINLEGDNEAKTKQKLSLEASAEAAKKYREELLRLQGELAKATEAQLSYSKRLDQEWTAEAYRLQENKQLTKETGAILQQTFDAKQISAFVEVMNKLGHETGEARKEWERISVESHKALGGEFAKEIEAGTKTLEEHGKALTKLAEEYQRLTQQAGSQSLGHRVAMVTAGGDHGNPLGALAIQQAMQRQDIENRYVNSLKLANETLMGGELIDKRAVLLKQRELELTELQSGAQEKAAQVRQKNVSDFFLDMQGQAQTAGNIFYEAMHSALDKVSDQFAKLITLQKTHFAEMFKSVGEQMLKQSIKSGLQQGLGKLGHHLGITGKPDGTTGNPYHVVIDGAPGVGQVQGPNQGSGEGPSTGSVIGGAASSAASGIGGFLKGLFSGGGGTSVTSSFTPMAEGGDVDPGHAYWVGENGPEPFVPSSAGSIVSRRDLGGGGDSHVYHIDARGAAMGTEQRIAMAIRMAHNSAVSTGVQANAERSKRRPGGK